VTVWTDNATLAATRDREAAADAVLSIAAEEAAAMIAQDPSPLAVELAALHLSKAEARAARILGPKKETP
jgi:hypothetical protein